MKGYDQTLWAPPQASFHLYSNCKSRWNYQAQFRLLKEIMSCKRRHNIESQKACYGHWVQRANFSLSRSTVGNGKRNSGKEDTWETSLNFPLILSGVSISCSTFDKLLLPASKIKLGIIRWMSQTARGLVPREFWNKFKHAKWENGGYLE